MAKNKKKGKKKQQNYEVGYCKPPEEYKWKKGCPSPNPKGRPKKVRTLKEALQISFDKEITIKNEYGEIKKISCLEALASKTVADAISKDGPTRRLLFRLDLLNLVSKEQEVEYTEEEQRLIDVENEYGKLLLQWAEVEPDKREKMARIISEALIILSNSKLEEGEQNG